MVTEEFIEELMQAKKNLNEAIKIFNKKRKIFMRVMKNRKKTLRTCKLGNVEKVNEKPYFTPNEKKIKREFDRFYWEENLCDVTQKTKLRFKFNQ